MEDRNHPTGILGTRRQGASREVRIPDGTTVKQPVQLLHCLCLESLDCEKNGLSVFSGGWMLKLFRARVDSIKRGQARDQNVGAATTTAALLRAMPLRREEKEKRRTDPERCLYYVHDV